MRTLLYVQHLLGSGHLQRVALITRALMERGVECRLLSGGMPVATINTDGLPLVQLPPLRANDSTFSRLVDADGSTVSQDYLDRRQAQLISSAKSFKPEVVLIESWPFGRRKLRAELIALLQVLQQQTKKPLVVCSIRDILHRGRSPERLRETVEHINQWIDHVLVHSDPEFVRLDHSFELASEIEPKVVYTGFVVRPEFAKLDWHPAAEDKVLVSAGGGAVGLALYECAIQAAQLNEGTLRWQLLIGSGVADSDFNRLVELASDTVDIEWARSDFPELLSRTSVSVSQSGYNTTMDLLNVGCPAVVVPFDADGETEQSDRAHRLQTLGLAQSLQAASLTPKLLLQAVKDQIGNPPRRWQADFHGTGTTAEWLSNIRH